MKNVRMLHASRRKWKKWNTIHDWRRCDANYRNVHHWSFFHLEYAPMQHSNPRSKVRRTNSRCSCFAFRVFFPANHSAQRLTRIHGTTRRRGMEMQHLQMNEASSLRLDSNENRIFYVSRSIPMKHIGVSRENPVVIVACRRMSEDIPVDHSIEKDAQPFSGMRFWLECDSGIKIKTDEEKQALTCFLSEESFSSLLVVERRTLASSLSHLQLEYFHLTSWRWRVSLVKQTTVTNAETKLGNTTCSFHSSNIYFHFDHSPSALCYHCSRDLCLDHLTQHAQVVEALVRSCLDDQFSILTDVATRLQSLTISSNLLDEPLLKLEQWRSNAYQQIDDIFQTNVEQIRIQIENYRQIFDTMRNEQLEKVNRYKGKIGALFRRTQVSNKDLAKLHKSIEQIQNDLNVFNLHSIEVTSARPSLHSIQVRMKLNEWKPSSLSSLSSSSSSSSLSSIVRQLEFRVKYVPLSGHVSSHYILVEVNGTMQDLIDEFITKQGTLLNLHDKRHRLLPTEVNQR